ncbi:uncharacterized protein LOC116805729 [Drosophila grimshawi]|uniref:uncharacterized protein LOC116805729 n=1 Tax=Drosophila grimshawi TaxID=7222 RepID=UPI000C8701F7|nr:uncharacterized protein LOC116805729 [Drosophila grimshawi]
MVNKPKTNQKRTTKNGDKSYEEKVEEKFRVTRYPPRRIPKHVLTRTLQIINDGNDEFWLNRNSSCAPPVNTTCSDLKRCSESHQKLNLARKCMVTRDFKSLAKLLTSNLIGENWTQRSAYPVFSEYFTILLSLEDPELLKKLQQTMSPSVLHSTTDKTPKDSSDSTMKGK